VGGMDESSPSDRPLVIVHVEDNPSDVFMVREALEEADIPHTLRVVENGALALGFLRRACADGGRPDLVILDLNLPAMSGREILAGIAADPELRALPVAILTTSREESGIGREFPGLRTTFAAKTPDYRELAGIVWRFRDFARRS